MANDKEIVEALVSILDKTGLGYSEAACAVGCSPSTLRHAIATRTLPGRGHPRRQILAFIERNAAASERTELRFV
jgi:hypothetical protein